MQLDSTFAVTAPIEQVWVTLMDFQRVAGCVPGAEVTNKLSEDAYQVGMKVKLGPVTMQYKGQMEVVERDAAGHRAVIKGSAKEARGQGTAQATARLQLVEEAGTTRGSVRADVALSGRAAAMGQGVIGSVTEQMMGQFATNLQAMLNEAGPAVATAVADPSEPAAATASSQASATAPSEASATAPTGPVATAPTAPAAGVAARPVSPAAATAATAPPVAPRVTAPPAAAPAAAAGGDSLDGLAVARGMAQSQLQEPGRVLQLLGLVAVVGYLLGQRSVRRQRAFWLSTMAR